MSFLYRTATTSARTIARQSALQIHAPTRTFAVSARARKSATDTLKDGLKAVDETVSGAAVKGIDKAEELKERAAGVAAQTSGEGKGKAAELAGEAKGKAAELKGKAKGAME